MKFYRIEEKRNGEWKELILNNGKPANFLTDKTLDQLNLYKKTNEYLAEREGTPVVEVRAVFDHEDLNSYFTPGGNYIKIINIQKGLGEGSWHCKKRKAWFWEKNNCQFKIKEDPACDSCVFCGEPEERK
jgi:hypothetical protein